MQSHFISAAVLAAVLAAAAPSATRGAVAIDLKPQFLDPIDPSGLNSVSLSGSPVDLAIGIEVFGTNTNGSDERLNAYTIADS
jgi:hypothetical protein